MDATKIALVTGAGSGIGKACSLALLNAGWAVVLAGRRLARLQEVAAMSDAGSRALPVETDVANPDAVKMLRLLLRLERVSRYPRPTLGEEFRDELIDCGEPLPALLAVFERHDAIEGSFDEESQGMLEVTPEPNLIIPFQGDSAAETLNQVRTAEPVPPRQLRAKLPRDLDTVCLRCLQKEPHRRYPSAATLAASAKSGRAN